MAGMPYDDLPFLAKSATDFPWNYAAGIHSGLGGAIEAIGRAVGPAMAIFRLPQDTIVPILMASIRKDGILLLAGPDLAKTLSAGQILVSTYLAAYCCPAWLRSSP